MQSTLATIALVRISRLHDLALLKWVARRLAAP
jgi:hypothetical protein